MSNVDNRMREFYNRGYHDALRDCDKFMHVVMERFGKFIYY